MPTCGTRPTKLFQSGGKFKKSPKFKKNKSNKKAKKIQKKKMKQSKKQKKLSEECECSECECDPCVCPEKTSGRKSVKRGRKSVKRKSVKRKSVKRGRKSVKRKSVKRKGVKRKSVRRGRKRTRRMRGGEDYTLLEQGIKDASEASAKSRKVASESKANLEKHLQMVIAERGLVDERASSYLGAPQKWANQRSTLDEELGELRDSLGVKVPPKRMMVRGHMEGPDT